MARPLFDLPFVEGVPDPREPWIEHRVDAVLLDRMLPDRALGPNFNPDVHPWIPGRIGYLKITYTPRAQWESFYPTVWHYMRTREGFTSIDPDGTEANIRQELSKYRWGWLSPDELERIKIRYSESMEKARKHHVDKPVVGFIRVGEEFRRQGVGRAMYLEAARIMQERGMYLYASGTQGPEAEAAWLKFEAEGLVVSVGERRHLRLPAYLLHAP